jgi:hypothetical protein
VGYETGNFFINVLFLHILQLYLNYLQSDVEEYMSQNGIADLLSISNTSSSSVTTTSPSSNEFNYSSDNTHSGESKVKCNENNHLHCNRQLCIKCIV